MGVWLLSGRWPAGAWAAAVLTFAAFAVVSASLGLKGQASCGCFGAVKTSPWLVFGVDLAVLATLAVARPDFRRSFPQQRESPPRNFMPTAGVVAGVLVLTAGLIGAATVAHGSSEAALARLRGESVSVRPRLAELGRGEVGREVETTVEVVNWTPRPVRVYGGTSDCSCIATKSLPLTVEPGERRQVAVTVRLPPSPGHFNRKAIFWTDCEAARTVVFGLTARVVASSSTPDE